jgi:hypothetical protein
MNSAKKFVSIAALGVVLVIVAGLVFGSIERAIAAPPLPQRQDVMVINTTSEPVPVLSQGTTNVSGSVDVRNWPIDPLPVAQQGSVEVNGTVGIDPNANAVTIDSAVPVAVSGKVEIDPTANTVKIDSAAPVAVAPQGTTNVAGSVSVSNPTSNPVPVAQQGAVSVSGSVGLSTSANTVKLDAANNTVKVTNPSGQALDVRVVEGGGGGSAPQPVQFSSTYTANFAWTNAYQVPAGKILKIEFVSVYAETDGLWPVVSMRTTLGGVTAEYWLPRLEVEWVQQEGNAAKIWSRSKYRMSTQVTIYADENTWVQSAGRCATSDCNNPGYNITFSGYLTDK